MSDRPPATVNVRVGPWSIHVFDVPSASDAKVRLSKDGYGEVRVEDTAELDALEAALRMARRAWFEAINGVSA